MTEAAHSPASRDRGRLADIVATVVLLVAHLFIYGATIAIMGLLVMATDPCGYRRCGDPAWIDRAIGLAGWGGGVILLADVVFTLVRVLRLRRTWFVPLIGCAAQVALGVGAAAMELLAGPV